MQKQKGKSNTTAIRGPPRGLGKVEDVHPAKDVFWMLMPLHASGPYGKDCISPGDFDMHGTDDQYIANLFNTLATISEETTEGGWLLRVSREDDILWKKVIEGIAKIEMGEIDANLKEFVNRRAYKGRYFDSNVTDAVDAAKTKLHKEKEAKRKKQDNRVTDSPDDVVCVFSKIVLIDTKGRFEPITINPRGYKPESFRDWQTDEDRERLARIKAAEKNQQQDNDNAPELTADDIAAAATAINDPENGVLPKWEVVMYALPARETDDMDIDGPEEISGVSLFTEDATREAIISSFNVNRDARTSGGRKIGAILWAFVKYDDTINSGKTIQRMIEHVRARNKFYSTRDTSHYNETPYVDPFLHLAPYMGRSHSVHTIDKKSYWRWVRLYCDESYKENSETLACTRWEPTSRNGKLHPRYWATLENALTMAERCDVDMTGLTTQSFIMGMQERLDNNIPSNDAIVGPDGFIRLKVPTRTDDAQEQIPVCDSWVWRKDSFRQVGDGITKGIFDTTFPFIDPLADNFGLDDSIREEEERMVVARERSNESRDGFDNYDPEDDTITDEICKEIDPNGLLSRRVVLGEFLRRRNMSKWEAIVIRISEHGAPFETDNVMIDNYYRKQRLEVETMKYFIHPDDNMAAYHKKWIPAMKRHTKVTEAWFRDALRLNASTNKYVKALLRGVAKHRDAGMKTLTSTQYLHDSGERLSKDLPQSQRDPENPGLDAFAHLVLKYLRQLRQNKGVEDPLTVWLASKACSSCYQFHPGRPLPLIVISAPAGEGKTYVLTVLKSLCIEGTTRQENHVSDMVATAGEDVDVAILTDEAKGILQKAKDASVNATEISKSTVAGTGTIASARAEYQVNPLTGKRELTVQEREYVHSKAWVVGTNAKQEELVTEMAARTTWFDKPKAFRPASALSWESFREWSKDTKDWNHVLQIARFHIYKGVQNGAIPSFHNMPTVNMIFTWMRDQLRSRGIEPMEGRHENRTQAKIKQYIIDDVVNWAIAAAIHTPGGPCYNDEMGMNLWLRISPLLYPTLQVIFWNIMALGHMWVSSHISHVLIAMLKVCNYKWKQRKTASEICFDDKDGAINWRKRSRFLTDEEKRQRDVVGGSRPQNINSNDNDNDNDNNNNNNYNNRNVHKKSDVEFLYDFNYVSAVDTPAFWQSVSNAMHPKHRQPPSWIKMMITSTATKQMFRPIGGAYPYMSDDDISRMKSTNALGQFYPWTAIDKSREKVSGGVPIVEIIKSGNYKRIFIATGAPDVLGGNELATAFLMSVISKKFTPRAFLLPNTHPKYRDILDKMTIRASDRDRLVEKMDIKIKKKYERNFRDFPNQRNARETENGQSTVDSLRSMSNISEDDESSENELDEDEAEVFEADVETSQNNRGDERIPQNESDVDFKDGLTGDWEVDKKLLCREYGISLMDESFMSHMDETILFEGGHEYSSILEADWDRLREAVMKKRSHIVKQIKVDLDEHSARERWIRCGLPLLDGSGNAIKVLSPQECLRRYHDYMEKHPELNPTKFSYPEDEIEERKKQDRPREILSTLFDVEIDVQSMSSHGDIYATEERNGTQQSQMSGLNSNLGLNSNQQTRSSSNVLNVSEVMSSRQSSYTN